MLIIIVLLLVFQVVPEAVTWKAWVMNGVLSVAFAITITAGMSFVFYRGQLNRLIKMALSILGTKRKGGKKA